jgi:hypothetical protein
MPVQSEVTLQPDVMQKWIPPLSLHVILENIIYTNALSKQQPLQIKITQDDSRIPRDLAHTVHEKTIVQNLNQDEGLRQPGQKI